ncbi:Pilus assembly protein PapD [Vibrio sp. B1FIG11]|uniref:fimbrial biogenesis chaperone n=1 Tax=Vibrio sp. B1FIG11 TaxID=2751177 RepID=UPI001AF92685|nr:molecular chaperone [Vibrio sp. B1FIG11]CAD7826902.1 Pilus assembly protein PapD [Vibrio sp. B1FIG11]CAE6962058.1 Pilus assembly protein PapD [Vibrio sp. B1FIG11]
MKKPISKFFFLASLAMSSLVTAAQGVYLGSTRVVYDSGYKSTSLTVASLEKKRSWLMRSWVNDGESKNKSNRFIITPPLHLLRPGGEFSLRINLIDKEGLPSDRESIFYINVMQIPRQSTLGDGNKLHGGVDFSITHTIKMFFRPSGLNNEFDVEKAQKGLDIVRQNGTNYLYNTSPYYISLKFIKIGGKDIPIENTMLKPFTGKTPLPKEHNLDTSELNYGVIDDLGGVLESTIIRI